MGSAARKWGLWALRGVWALTLGVMVLTTIVRAPYNYQATFQQWAVANTAARIPGMSWVSFTQYILGLRYTGAALFALIGIAVFVLRPRSGMAILVSMALIGMPLLFSGFGVDPGTFRLTRQGVPEAVIPLLNLGNFLAVSNILLTLYLFPDGKFAPRWLRWTLIGWGIVLFGAAVLGDALEAIWLAFFALLIALPVLMLIGQGYRYFRVSDAIQKQQTRLVVAGILVQPLTVLIPLPMRAIDSPWYTLLSLHALVLIPLLLPITFALSILRYRLWDIEVVIRRTLVYSIITVTLAAVYFVTVAAFQAIFTWVMGTESALALVVSTLVIAALFTPLRRRVQDAIDQQFFRHKYDAQQTIDAFAETIRDDVDVEVLRQHLIAVVETTMQPEHVSLWMPRERWKK